MRFIFLNRLLILRTVKKWLNCINQILRVTSMPEKEKHLPSYTCGLIW